MSIHMNSHFNSSVSHSLSYINSFISLFIKYISTIYCICIVASYVLMFMELRKSFIIKFFSENPLSTTASLAAQIAIIFKAVLISGSTRFLYKKTSLNFLNIMLEFRLDFLNSFLNFYFFLFFNSLFSYLVKEL